MTFAVYVEQFEEIGYGRPPVLDFVKVGVRKTRSGAETLIEKHIGKIYGYQKKGDYESLYQNSKGRALVKEGWF